MKMQSYKTLVLLTPTKKRQETPQMESPDLGEGKVTPPAIEKSSYFDLQSSRRKERCSRLQRFAVQFFPVRQEEIMSQRSDILRSTSRNSAP